MQPYCHHALKSILLASSFNYPFALTGILPLFLGEHITFLNRESCRHLSSTGDPEPLPFSWNPANYPCSTGDHIPMPFRRRYNHPHLQYNHPHLHPPVTTTISTYSTTIRTYTHPYLQPSAPTVQPSAPTPTRTYNHPHLQEILKPVQYIL
jgi:hypothetical protein